MINRAIISAAILASATVGVLAAAIPQENPYRDLIGKWDVQTDDGQYTFVWEFALVEGKLAGKHTGMSGTVEMENLKYEGGKLTFTVRVGGGGQSMSIDFVALVAGETLSGTLSLQFGEANITGKKKKNESL